MPDQVSFILVFVSASLLLFSLYHLSKVDLFIPVELKLLSFLLGFILHILLLLLDGPKPKLGREVAWFVLIKFVCSSLRALDGAQLLKF